MTGHFSWHACCMPLRHLIFGVPGGDRLWHVPSFPISSMHQLLAPSNMHYSPHYRLPAHCYHYLLPFLACHYLGPILLPPLSACACACVTCTCLTYPTPPVPACLPAFLWLFSFCSDVLFLLPHTCLCMPLFLPQWHFPLLPHTYYVACSLCSLTFFCHSFSLPYTHACGCVYVFSLCGSYSMACKLPQEEDGDVQFGVGGGGAGGCPGAYLTLPSPYYYHHTTTHLPPCYCHTLPATTTCGSILMMCVCDEMSLHCGDDSSFCALSCPSPPTCREEGQYLPGHILGGYYRIMKGIWDIHYFCMVGSSGTDHDDDL